MGHPDVLRAILLAESGAFRLNFEFIGTGGTSGLEMSTDLDYGNR
jgi:hypothetical protein